MENKHFVVYIPFFSEYPYGTYVVSKAHKQNIAEFTDEEKDSLAQILRDITGTYDSLFDKQFPYMMCMYQNPVNSQDTKDYYHFRIVFFRPCVMKTSKIQRFQRNGRMGTLQHNLPRKKQSKCEMPLKIQEKHS